jgi:hypothetical protein
MRIFFCRIFCVFFCAEIFRFKKSNPFSAEEKKFFYRKRIFFAEFFAFVFARKFIQVKRKFRGLNF